MGDFLSTANKKKESENGSNDYIKYGSCSMQGWRKRMEDSHITDLSKGEEGRYQIFGVFDGHGGKEVAQFVKNHFTETFLSNSELQKDNIKEALKQTFLKMDDLMRTPEGKEELKKLNEISEKEDKEQDELNKKNNPEDSRNDFLRNILSLRGPKTDIAGQTGCTACVCVIDIKHKKMYFANAGDSRVVLCRNGIAEPMSTDHKPELEEEKKRIYEAEGWITEGRVKGNLNLTRGFGDLEYKGNVKLTPEQQMITANPDIKVIDWDSSCDFIIVGCDGIWDCLTNQEACDRVKTGIKENPDDNISNTLEKILDSICATDLYNETGIGCDNMTVCVALFKK